MLGVLLSFDHIKKMSTYDDYDDSPIHSQLTQFHFVNDLPVEL
jgi:hypothetical protein